MKFIPAKCQICLEKPHIIMITMALLITALSLPAQEWELMYESEGLELLEAISFPDSVHGWMVGKRPGAEEAFVLHSKNGGESWSELNSKLTRPLLDVHFFDSLTGYILSASEVIKTVDGGSSWEEVDLGEITGDRMFTDMEFVDSIGWIIGGNGTILKTLNSGDSWDQLESLPLSSYTEMDFANADTGAIIGFVNSDKFILQTSDGGITWTEATVESEFEYILEDIHFADDATVIAAGHGGFVLRSMDGGITWNEVSRLVSPGQAYLWARSMHFENARRGWIASQINSSMIFIHRTADGGETWTLEISTTMNSPRVEIDDILFDESGTGWVCGFKQEASKNNGAYILKRVPVVLPEALCKDIDAYLDETGTVRITPEMIDNGSSDNSGIIDTMWVEPEVLRCVDVELETKVTLYVADPAGNINTCESAVTLLDTITLKARCKDATIQLDSTGYGFISADDINDVSRYACLSSTDVVPFEFSTEDVGVQEVAYILRDRKGNIDTCYAQVTVEAYVPVSVPPELYSSPSIQLSSHPNPFGSSSSIEVSLSKAQHVVLDVYNSAGQLVQRLFEGELPSGQSSFTFGENGVENGIYFCRISSEEGFFMHKIIKAR